jgi:hypothetical protein
MSQTVSFKIKIEGSDSFKIVTADAGEVAEAIRKINQRTNELNGNLVNTAAAMQVVDRLSSMLSGLESAVDSLTSGYRAQSEELSKLKRIMRNTMDATEDEIDSVRRLIKEQERKGIVSEEAQLAAAQELATYLTMSDSLEAIIPTMNNMIAQQLGMGASAESAAQIATQLGKVMQGQTTALSRNGYAFSEAQQHILLYGDEMERAHVLCQVVDESVAGVNETTRQSDAGKILDISNAFNQVKDSVGQALNFLLPYVKTLSKVGQGVTGIMQLVSSYNALSKTQGMVAINAKIEALALERLKRKAVETTIAKEALAKATTKLKWAIGGGLTVAITALTVLFAKLASKGKDAADGIKKAKEAEDEYARASTDARTALASELVTLETLIKSKQDTTRAVDELNNKYGESFGYYKTAKEWYDILINKSKEYAHMIGLEAKQKLIASQLAEKELELENRQKQLSVKQKHHVETWDSTDETFGTTPTIGGLLLQRGEKKQFGVDAARNQALDLEIEADKQKIEDLQEEITKIKIDLGFYSPKSTPDDGSGGKGYDLASDIDKYKKSVQDAIKVNKALDDERDKENIVLNARRSGLASLISTYGLENAEVQELIVRYRELRHLKNTREGVLPKSVTALNQPKPIIEKLPKLPEINIEDLTFEDTIMSAEDAVTALNALGSTMSSLKGIVGEGAAGWLEWGANILQAVAQALPALSTLFAANTSVAAAEGAASVASIPYVGPVMAVAAIASIVGAIASLPKFAQGGLVYGPTLGLFGEYAGASSNPEVVAPLDKLRELIAPPSSEFGKVEFVIEGRNLKGVLNRVNRMDSRNNG